MGKVKRKTGRLQTKFAPPNGFCKFAALPNSIRFAIPSRHPHYFTMHPKIRSGLFLSLVLVAAIQAIPVERTNPQVASDFDGPLEVKKILQRSCYDCHSNETRWPWYSYVAPVSWLVVHDVNEGRAELNFSDWDRYSRDSEKIEEISEETGEGEMPLPIYLIMHADARLSAGDRATLQNWSNGLAR